MYLKNGNQYASTLPFASSGSSTNVHLLRVRIADARVCFQGRERACGESQKGASTFCYSGDSIATRSRREAFVKYLEEHM